MGYKTIFAAFLTHKFHRHSPEKGNTRNIPLFTLPTPKTKGIKFCKSIAQMSHMDNNDVYTVTKVGIYM